jgi:VWFA-related protein
MKVNDGRRFFSLLLTSTFYFSLFTFSFHVSSAAQSTPLFRAAADVVVVPVTVTDRSGRFVRRLTADQFEISEDGTGRAIVQFSADRVPVSLAILLDASGSMAQNPQERAEGDARWADTRRALELLLARLNAADEVLLAAFSDKVAASPWTREHAGILKGFDSILPGGGTALLDAVRLIVPAFQRARHRRKVLLLISDGNDTQALVAGYVPPPPPQNENPNQNPLADIDPERARRERAIQGSRNAVRKSGALMYAVGIGTRKGVAVDAVLLESLTRDSGGYAAILRDPSQIAAAVAGIADDLQSQYLLAFEPGAADGSYHAIRVRTKDTRLRVRARAGYFASPAAPK